VEEHGQSLQMANVRALTEYALGIRRALGEQGLTGAGGEEIDHIELFGPPTRPGADSRNFVLCPGGAFDRSPCGTGTSAKLACLAASGQLAEGQRWVQESIIGSTFSGSYRWAGEGGRILPTLTGPVHVTAEAELILSEADPFCWGIDQPGERSG